LTDIRAGYDYVKQAPLLQRLAVSAVLFSVLYFSVSYPFGQAVSAAFSNEADLAGFLGLFKGVSGALMFVAALLIANRLYARIGIVLALLLLPITYLLGFGLFALSFTLVSAVIVRLAQFVVLSGIGDGAYSAFFNVVPAERRAQVRAFDSGVPSQIGVVLSGILLILGGRVLSTSAIFGMGMIVALICAWVVWGMRRSYLEALMAALRAGRLEIFTQGERIFAGLSGDGDALRTVTRALSDPKPATRQIAAEMLGRIGAESAALVMITALGDESPPVRAALVRSLGQMSARQAARPVTGLLQDESPEVRMAALAALPGLIDPGEYLGASTLIRPLLSDPHFGVRLQAALNLADCGEANLALRSLLDSLDGTRDQHEHSQLLRSFAPVLEAADPASQDASLANAALVRFLEDGSPAVRQAACQGLAGGAIPAALNALADRLADPVEAVREQAGRSLKLAGGRAVPLVLARLQAGGQTGILLDALPPGEAGIVEPLRSFARQELQRLQFWRQAARALPDSGRAGKFLLFLLEDRAVRAEQHLIKVIGLLGNADVMELVGRTLRTGDSETRAAAVEALDTLGDKQLVKAILPVLEPAPVEDAPGPEQAGRMEKALSDLLADEDAWLRAAAIRMTGEMGLVNLIPVIRQMNIHPDALIAEAARDALHQMGENVETLQTLSLVERTLLLKEVPLFGDLSPDDLAQVAQTAGERWFPDGAVICAEGEPGDEMFIIASGRARVTKQANGTVQELAIREAGEFIGEMAVIESEPRAATVSAVGETRTLTIGAETFKAILRDRPEVTLALLRGLSRRLRQRG
jgi:HEAT repeat protein